MYFILTADLKTTRDNFNGLPWLETLPHDYTYNTLQAFGALAPHLNSAQLETSLKSLKAVLPVLLQSNWRTCGLQMLDTLIFNAAWQIFEINHLPEELRSQTQKASQRQKDKGKRKVDNPSIKEVKAHIIWDDNPRDQKRQRKTDETQAMSLEPKDQAHNYKFDRC